MHIAWVRCREHIVGSPESDSAADTDIQSMTRVQNMAPGSFGATVQACRRLRPLGVFN